MRKVVLALLAGAALALGTAGSAFAVYDPNGNSCDAGHGAFGAFSHHTGTWIPQDAQTDGGLGHETGPTNSGFSAYCQTLR